MTINELIALVVGPSVLFLLILFASRSRTGVEDNAQVPGPDFVLDIPTPQVNFTVKRFINPDIMRYPTSIVYRNPVGDGSTLVILDYTFTGNKDVSHLYNKVGGKVDLTSYNSIALLDANNVESYNTFKDLESILDHKKTSWVCFGD